MKMIAMLLIMLMAGSAANNLRPKQEHISMIQSEISTERSGKVVKVLQSLSKSMKKAMTKVHKKDSNDQDSDDDDDEEDDDEESKSAKPADDAAEKELAEAKADHKDAKSELEAFNDEAAFEQKINAEVNLMTNETQSPTLSTFLGDLRVEMRKYNEPTYPAYLEKQVAAAEKRVAELEAELGKEPSTKPKAAAVKVEAPKVEAPKAEKPEEKKEKKDKKPEKTDSKATDDVASVAQKSGEVWALSFFANVILLAVVFAMANTANEKVRGNSWFLIDQVIAIFLAVMYFNAFNSFMDFGDFGTHNEVLSGIIHAVVMLFIVLFAAYKLRNDGVSLAILCGAGAHLVSFSSIDAAADTQNKVWVATSYTWTMMIAGIFVLGLGLFVVGYLVYTAKKRANVLDSDDFMDKTDDLENDFGSMAFSVVFTMFVRYLLTGHHPVDDDTDFDHTANQRTAMLIYAVVALVVATFLTPYFAKKASDAADKSDYAKKRIWTFLTTVTAMNVAWAWLYWGEWEFMEALFPGEAIKGRVMFAITMSCAGAIGIIGISKMQQTRTGQTKTAKSAEKVATTALGLLVAWSWELCFDAAVEDMVEGSAHPVAWKVTSTLCLFAVILPVYGYYVKPAVAANGGDA